MDKVLQAKWATDSAAVLQEIVTLSPVKRQEYIDRGLNNVSRFNLEKALDQIEMIYKTILC